MKGYPDKMLMIDHHAVPKMQMSVYCSELNLMLKSGKERLNFLKSLLFYHKNILILNKS